MIAYYTSVHDSLERHDRPSRIVARTASEFASLLAAIASDSTNAGVPTDGRRRTTCRGSDTSLGLEVGIRTHFKSSHVAKVYLSTLHQMAYLLRMRLQRVPEEGDTNATASL